jgi:glutamate-1-semialdehyde 2,1-aminomutase
MFCRFFTHGPVIDLDSARLSDTQRFAEFFHACVDRGVYFAPSQFETNFISTAHSAADIEETAKIMRETLANL